MTIRALLVAVLLLGTLPVLGGEAGAATTLTADQRRAYLYYYAPVIFKRGDENSGKAGRDWLTNYDFDQDGDYSDNRVDWLKVDQYADGGSAQWRIRPTLYSALIQFADGGGTSLVLLFHVYNAADKEGTDIHDWERVEIIVRNVTGTPGGAGEAISSATLTHHSDHVMRRPSDPGFNVMTTATGRHLMVWQADEAGSVLATHGHELRYVTDPYAVAMARTSGQVTISGKDKKENVHYVFAPAGDPAAVAALGARPLNRTTAAGLASRVDNETTVPWSQVKRVTYELQDLADVIPTHWSGGTAWHTDWLPDTAVDIWLESPVGPVPAGRQRFYTASRDSGASDLTDGRDGIPSKVWFYGAYSAELDEDWPSGSDDFKAFSGQGTDSAGLTRGAASGRLDSHGQYWWQHDFFVHSGAIDGAGTREAGRWLTGSWYTAASGGFDGRWEPLFDDRPGQEAQ